MSTNKKITELTAISTGQIANDDVFPIVDVSESTTKKASILSLIETLSGVTSLTAQSPVVADASTGDVTLSLTTVPVTKGGTNATTAADARTNLGVTATGADTTYAYRANNLSDLASASTARTNLGLGSISTQNSSNVSITGGSITGITDLAVADGGTGASDAATARTNLGVTATGSDTTYAYRANNLSDLASASTARTNLGLGSISTQDASNVTITGGSITGITDLAVADGGTGASTAPTARTNLGAAASGANSDITSLTGLTTALSVAQGGTGSTTLTANNVILGNGTSAVQVVAPGTSGNVLTSNGTTWTSSSLPASTDVTSFSAGTTGFTPSTATSGAVTLAGTLAVANGGTGATTASAAATALGVGTGNSPTFAGLNIDTASGVDGQWDTTGLTVYANGVTPQHDGPLHVMSGSAGTVAAPSYSDELIVESAGQGGITMLSPDASSTNLVFGSPTAQRYAHLQGNYTSGYLEMATFKSGAKFLFSPDNQSQRGEWNTTGLTVHASGVTAQHDGVLHVMSGSAGTVTASSSGDEIVVEGNGQTGISLLAPDNSSTRIYFGGPTGTNTAAQLLWDYNAGSPVFNFGTLTGASSLINFYAGAATQVGQWNTTGLTCFASGVTPQHDGVLHVMSGSAGTVTASVAADELIVEGPGNASGGISILNADANDCNIFFGCPSDNIAAMFQWNYTSKLLAMSTRTAGGYLRFGVEDEGYRGEWTTTGLTCYASGVTPQHDSVLHAMKGTAGTWTSDSGGIIVAESNGAAGIYIGTPDANAGTLGFSSPTKTGASGAIVQFTYDTGIMYYRTFKTGAVMTFRTGNDVEALTLNSSQQMVAATTYSTTVGATNRDLYIDNTGLIGYVSSLQAAKTEIQPITDTSWLHSLNPISFKYRKKNEAGQYTNEIDGDIQYGMIAEEVEAVRPDLCFYDDVADLDANGEKTETTHKELRGIQYSKLVPVLLKEVQKLRTELNQMKAN